MRSHRITINKEDLTTELRSHRISVSSSSLDLEDTRELRSHPLVFDSEDDSELEWE